MARVTFVAPARDDLEKLDRDTLRRVLKKIQRLESEPKLGLPLGGDLTGFRKLVVGNCDWRIIYRIAEDQQVVIIWVVGPRANDRVYKEASKRLARLDNDELANSSIEQFLTSIAAFDKSRANSLTDASSAKPLTAL